MLYISVYYARLWSTHCWFVGSFRVLAMAGWRRQFGQPLDPLPIGQVNSVSFRRGVRICLSCTCLCGPLLIPDTTPGRANLRRSPAAGGSVRTRNGRCAVGSCCVRRGFVRVTSRGSRAPAQERRRMPRSATAEHGVWAHLRATLAKDRSKPRQLFRGRVCSGVVIQDGDGRVLNAPTPCDIALVYRDVDRCRQS